MFDDASGLIERCISREEKAWSEFIDRFSGLVYYSARERLGRSGIRFREQDIEDIAQDVFVEIWEKARLEEVRERNKIGAWISIMTQTRALNYMRSKKEFLLREDELYKIGNISSSNSGQRHKELIEELEKLIEPFPAREKVILKLNIIYQKAHKEIADFMGMPINTVSTIIARRKEFLRKRL